MPRREEKLKRELIEKLKDPNLTEEQQVRLQLRLEKVKSAASKARAAGDRHKSAANVKRARNSEDLGKLAETNRGIIVLAEQMVRNGQFNGTVKEYLQALRDRTLRVDPVTPEEMKIPGNDPYWTSDRNPRHAAGYWKGKA